MNLWQEILPDRGHRVVQCGTGIGEKNNATDTICEMQHMQKGGGVAEGSGDLL